MILNCVVVDDESEAIEEIAEYISKSGYLKLLHAFDSSQEALVFIQNTLNIDIIFIDVDMPFMNGSELSSLVRGHTKLLIFTTSHAKYALDAFEVSADAFLLKPFNFAKFTSTVQKAHDKIGLNDSAGSNGYIFIKSKEDNLKLIKVFIEDIIAIESQLNYIKIYTTTGKIITHLSLKEAKQTLKNQLKFLQLHRSFLIAPKHILSIDGNIVTMIDGTIFNVGANFRQKFQKFLSHFLLKSVINWDEVQFADPEFNEEDNP